MTSVKPIFYAMAGGIALGSFLGRWGLILACVAIVAGILLEGGAA